MALLLLVILILIEAGSAFMASTANSTKKEWTKKRLTVCALEIAVYLIMLLLPGIDTGFRFKGLLVLLAVRILLAGIFALANRHNEKAKKKAAIIAGAVLSILVLAVSLIPAFLFTGYQGRPVTGNYRVAETAAILVDHARPEAYEKDGSSREVPAHFYYPADAAGPEHSLPLIIFSHGAFGYYQSNTSTYQELASNGYVVISLDHPYHSFYTEDTGGKTIPADPAFLQSAMQIGNSERETAEVYEVTSGWMDLREADMNFVIDTVKKAAGGNIPEDVWYIKDSEKDHVTEALALTDTDRIGLIGHSLGGATAVTVGRREDVSAAVDLDGTMLGEELVAADGELIINSEPYETPLLSFDNEEHHYSREEARQAGYPYANNVILDNAAEGYSTYIRGSAHMDFTDLPFFSPFLAKLLGKGSVDAGECMDTVNAVVLDFFDCYLKGTGEFSVNESY